MRCKLGWILLQTFSDILFERNKIFHIGKSKYLRELRKIQWITFSIFLQEHFFKLVDFICKPLIIFVPLRWSVATRLSMPFFQNFRVHVILPYKTVGNFFFWSGLYIKKTKFPTFLTIDIPFFLNSVSKFTKSEFKNEGLSTYRKFFAKSRNHELFYSIRDLYFSLCSIDWGHHQS